MKYRKKVEKLNLRIKAYEELDNKSAYKKPGSLSGKK